MQRVKHASPLIRYKHGDLTAARLWEKLARCLFLEEPFYLKLWLANRGSLAAAWGISAFDFFDAETSYEAAFIYNCRESFQSIFKETRNSLHAPQGRGWKVWFD